MESKRVFKVIGTLAVLAWLGFTLSGCGVLPFGANLMVHSGETINEVIAQAQPGWTIYVPLGTYPGDVTIDKDGITLIGESGSKPKIDGDLIVTSDNVTINNFEVTGKLETIPGSFANLSLINTDIWGVTLNTTLSCDAVVNPPETIQAAIDAATPGDTVCVAPGTYTEQLTIGESLTLQAVSTPTIDLSGCTDYGIKVTADNVTIDGFTIIGIPYSGSTSSNVNPTIDAEANYVTVQNCVFNTSGGAVGKEAMVARPGTNHINYLSDFVKSSVGNDCSIISRRATYS